MGNLQLDDAQTLPNQITKAPERPSGERVLYKNAAPPGGAGIAGDPRGNHCVTNVATGRWAPTLANRALAKMALAARPRPMRNLASRSIFVNALTKILSDQLAQATLPRPMRRLASRRIFANALTKILPATSLHWHTATTANTSRCED